MNRKMSLLVLFGMITLLLAACGGASQKYVAGESLLNETFSSADAWETFSSDSAELGVSDGVYEIQIGDDGYIWGLNETEHTDVVIDVTAAQLSSHANNAYGVICRSDVSNNGDGYYFLVSGDGFYSISKGEGDDVSPLVEWTPNSAINEGQATNKIRAVCIGNYLALWVNDKFMTEIEDTAYTSGFTGLAAAAFEGGDADITFDDLTISAASLPE